MSVKTSRLGRAVPRKPRVQLLVALLALWMCVGSAAVAQLPPALTEQAFGSSTYLNFPAIGTFPGNTSGTLVFNISNSNNFQLTGVGFTDTLPAGLEIAEGGTLLNSCGGSVTLTFGSGSTPSTISLSGVTLAPEPFPCELNVQVIGVKAGFWINTTGPVTSTEEGSGNTASAALLVVAPPVPSLSFNPFNIPVNGTSTLTLILSNPAGNMVPLNQTAISAGLPAGMQVANAPNVINSCGGTVVSGGTAGDTQINLQNVSLNVNALCGFSVNVTAATAGAFQVVTSNTTCCSGITGFAALNILDVGAPTTTQAFGLPMILTNGTTTLTINLANPNASLTLTGVEFNDVLPVGLGLEPPTSPDFSNGCGGNLVFGFGLRDELTLSGVTLAPGVSCTVRVDVLGVNGGVKNNAVAAFASQGGSGDLSASTATITVLAPITPDDFNGDGFTDLLWRNSNTRDVALWLMNGASKASSSVVASAVDPNWEIVGMGDFNGDGRADILWQNSSAGEVVLWFMDGVKELSAATVATGIDPSWQVAGVGDFNGDGKADILWRNSSTGDLAVWLMNGATKTSSGVVATAVDPSWQIVGVGDFDGDGRADILWQNANSGALVLWFMNGTSKTSAAFVATSVDLNWKVVGVGDFNGDGRADILWRNSTTGDVAVWLMNGATKSSSGVVASAVDPAWQIVGINDFNGDGKADVLWQNSSTGGVALWLMNGATKSSSTFVATSVDPAWQIVPFTHE